MAPSTTIRRLLRETIELSDSSPNPTPAFHAAPVSDEDLHEWHFTLLGPPAPSPYAGGLYHGRITLPPQYPLKPPNFRFLTPSGRFEVNREICLSISGFHEETWMPAWGVRTALTALRTFMAEPGTAGQVGGLEAPEHVRKRLAGESRRWRCGGCNEGKTNEDIMKEWWERCREKGVKVDEEGEDVGLEVLPEGMNVEARSMDKGKGKEEAPLDASSQIPITGASQPPTQQTPAPAISQPQSQPPSPIQRQPQQQQLPPPPSIPASASPPDARLAYFSPTPTPEQTQRAAEARLTPSDYPSTASEHQQQQQRAQQRPMLNLHRPPLAAASAALAENAQALQTVGDHRREVIQHQQEPQTTVTIDRAIAGVFLMLVLMVLKKIFYPSGMVPAGWDGVGGSAPGGGAGGMEREL
jgi:ubiquitin-conjugating enzyme E2 J1